jgi:hypothetical protein
LAKNIPAKRSRANNENSEVILPDQIVLPPTW